MTNDELDRLAALIVAEMQRVAPAPPAPRAGTPGPWLPIPVRPEPPGPAGDPPAWSGAGQSLGDVAPGPGEPSSHRDDIGRATASIRAAAAGQAPGRQGTASGRASHGNVRPVARARGGTIEVSVAVSNRHVHLSEADAQALFGTTALTPHRPLVQPGQFAAEQRVCAVGPKGRIEGIRVVGPARGATQLEISLGDAAVLGVVVPVVNSGRLEDSGGGVILEGPGGKVSLERGVIVPARHLHLAPEDGRRWHLRDGDVVTVRCGESSRATTWHGVLVRCGPTHATELHLDVDEARAAGVASGAKARVVAHAPAPASRRPVLTERDVVRLATHGEPLPANALLTPSARDRARALGLAPP